MIVRDWRAVDAEVLQTCYEAEERSWRDDLRWDTSWTWSTIEEARVRRGLQGAVAIDAAGAVGAWGFVTDEGGTLHVGGLVSSAPHATVALLDAMLRQRTPRHAVACFIRDRAPGLEPALTARGFAVERFLYLSRAISRDAGLEATPVDGPRGRPPGERRLSRRWDDRDLPQVAGLLAAAYSTEAARHFAPAGTPDAWMQYLRGLTTQRGCGVFDPEASRIVRGRLDASTALEGTLLVTRLAPETAHVAQLAVHPGARRHGIAASLLAEALEAAEQSGRRVVTLLVEESNGAARQLYSRFGFEPRGSFIAARREPHV